MVATDSSPAEVIMEDTPPGSRIQSRLVGDQLVLYLQPGTSSTTSDLGCFSVAWLAFIGFVTCAMLFGNVKMAPGPANIVFAIVIMIVFWIVGLTMFYLWSRGRFGKTYVLVEQGRLVMKSSLFGRETYREHALNADSRAEMVEAYRQNDRPVYALSLTTDGRPVKFGTFLSNDDKQWLLERINRHLGIGADEPGR